MEHQAIGLTGGIATGKSVVCGMFRRLGVKTLSGDDIAGEVMGAGSAALRDLALEFGERILTETGELNRRVMLNLLLDNPANLAAQLRVLGPHIIPEIDSRVRNLQGTYPDHPIMVEAPLLFEYGQENRYSPIIVVTVPREIQIQRLRQRSGQSRCWAESVIDLQWSMERKVSMADYVIDNSGSIEETAALVEEIFGNL